MIRTFAITAALATASAVALASPASAQTYGGVTLSFGSGNHRGYDYDDDGEVYQRGGYYTYVDPRVRRDYYYNDPGYAWRVHERQEQIERWRENQERRQRWEHERQERQQWRDRDDDD